MKEGDQDFTVMRIIIKGIEKGEKVSYQYNLLDRYQNNTISMARTTGFTCTAVANLVLEKKYDKIGISPPEYLGDHFEYISKYLSQRNVDYKVNHPVFSKDNNGKTIISYIDQFPEPKNMDQGLFLQKLSDALEESKNKISFPLPVGSTIFSNNYFWLHGRKAFKEHSGLSRELLRIRGTFFH